ncbi:GDSL-type esterase/lipase family protein [Paenibacillus sp. FSL K6-2524]|uniref:GDSL-type esterase/lipase family protein n=1 Tax=Paenibacillus sp. FSL K6-2524 TaxID=2954516 RepID=UPI0030FCD86A
MMNSTSRIWTTTGLISGVSTVLLLCGFFYAVKDIMNPLGAPIFDEQTRQESVLPTPEIESVLDVTAIGDSLAKGTGDDTGNGYARRTVQILKERGDQSKLVNNLGINGLTTAKLIPLLDEKGVQYVLKQSGVILLSIGGNDLFQETEKFQSGGEFPTEMELEKSVTEASENFKQIVKKLVDINPDAQLVYVSLYNPFADLEGIKEIGNKAVTHWNSLAMQTMSEYKRTLVVPTYDLFSNNGPLYLSGDHFHPNGEGYQSIAERIVQGLGKSVVE